MRTVLVEPRLAVTAAATAGLLTGDGLQRYPGETRRPRGERPLLAREDPPVTSGPARPGVARLQQLSAASKAMGSCRRLKNINHLLVVNIFPSITISSRWSNQAPNRYSNSCSG